MSGLLSAHRRSGGAPPATTTWNPSDKNAAITLSGGNLTASITGNSGFKSVRGTASHANGKWYFEITISTMAAEHNQLCGIATDDLSLTTYVGSNLLSVGYYALNGNVYKNGVVQAAIATYAASNVIYIAVDLDNNKIWFKKNGGFWNGSGTADPATNTGGLDVTPDVYFPAWSGEGFASGVDTAVLNCGASGFNGSVPAGFTAWNG